MAVGGLVLVLASCSSGPEPETAAATTSTAAVVSVDDVLAGSAAAMAAVDTVAFTIERTGADVSIDEAGAIRFDAAEGRFAAPAAAEAVLDVEALGFATQVGAVAIDGETWLTNPVSGDWELAPEDLGFDPATLFDPEVGFAALLADGLADPVLVDPEPDAQGRYQVRGTAAAERVATLTGGLADEATEIELWIDAGTGRVQEARFESDTAEGPATWHLTLTDYGADVTITEPDVG